MRSIILLFTLFVLSSAIRRELIVVTKDPQSKIILPQTFKYVRFDPILPRNLVNIKSDTAIQLSKYFHVQAKDEHLEILQQMLLKDNNVETAYIKPAPELAVLPEFFEKKSWTEKTPNFEPLQVYLNEAPEGLSVKSVFDIPGGKGENITLIDIELGWDFDHEDLIEHSGKVLIGDNAPLIDYKNHGTAVLGEVAGVYNGFGVTGIACKTRIFGASILSGQNLTYPSFPKIIVAATTMLSPGDIILVELHAPGPAVNFTGNDTQFGYIAMEYWWDNHLAMKYATEKGIIVVQAAGNGYQNLDDPIYSKRPKHFPIEWRNPFDRKLADSHAITVGAGAPPPETGFDYGPDRSRLDFSNYGAVVDAQGYGRGVCTTGYGDLQNGTRQVLYTRKFSGTSSASPIVVGAISATQGIVKARGKPPIKPLKMRELLRETGSPQQDGRYGPKSQNIGNRPDLAQLLSRL